MFCNFSFIRSIRVLSSCSQTHKDALKTHFEHLLSLFHSYTHILTINLYSGQQNQCFHDISLSNKPVFAQIVSQIRETQISLCSANENKGPKVLSFCFPTMLLLLKLVYGICITMKELTLESANPCLPQNGGKRPLK